MQSRSPEADLLIGVGSQGTAALAIFIKLLRALISKGVLQPTEVAAILDAAAESAEASPDVFGGLYSKSVGAAIRQMMPALAEPTPPPQRRH